MLLLPPGAAKSIYGSILYPPWLFSRFSNFNIIAASHTLDLAEQFSGKVQQRIRDNQDVLPFSILRQAVEQWNTSNGCEYKCAGVNSAIAGFRADCLPGDTIVQTPSGAVRLDKVEVGTETGYVLSYDEGAKTCTFRRVVAKLGRRADTLWRIRTASGRVVEATGNHRFYTGRGWVAAASLAVGDVLLSSVRSGGTADGGGSVEAPGSPAVLRQDVFHAGEQYRSWNGAKGVSHMRFASAIAAGRGAPETVLFGSVFPTEDGREWHKAQDDKGSPMCDLRGYLSPEVECLPWTVLLPALQRQGTFRADEGRSEPVLAARQGFGARQSAGVVESETTDLGTGWDALRSVPFDDQSGSSPHQHDSHGSSAGKLSGAVQGVPSQTAFRGAFTATGDAVSLVECIRREGDVYDIQVEGTECFFANGILVHNCGIIDDPVKSRKDVESETQRDHAWNWYLNDFLTRLKPGARQVFIVTRWHEDDLAGRVLAHHGSQWEVIRIPAIAGAGDPLGRSPGEPLWSDDSYGYAADLDVKRSQLGDRDWESLYQQNPTPLEGGVFKVGQIGIAEAVPAGTMWVSGWDFAATKETGTNDPSRTVRVKLGLTPAGRYIVGDVLRLTGGPEETEAAFYATAQRDGKAIPISAPKDPGQAGKWQASHLSKGLTGFMFDFSPESGDKATRAAAFASQANVGNVDMLRASWNDAYIEELRSFPNGTHDDQVDATSRAFHFLTEKASVIQRFRAMAS